MKPSRGISVTFLKGKDGLWHSYSAYAEDVDCGTMVKFMECIGNAVDALNKKGGKQRTSATCLWRSSWGCRDQEEFDKLFDESFIKYFQDVPNGYDQAMKLLDEVQVSEDLKAMAKERFNRIYEQSKKGGEL